MVADSLSGRCLPISNVRELRLRLAPLNSGTPALKETGKIAIGVERKTIGDMLNCIDDARYSAHQRPGMLAMYQKSILMIEGEWKPDVDTGYLMELVNTLNWRVFRQRSMMVRYNKLFRYLLTVQFSGVTVIWSRNIEQTAYNICEIYHWFQKPWVQHTSLMEMQKL